MGGGSEGHQQQWKICARGCDCASLSEIGSSDIVASFPVDGSGCLVEGATVVSWFARREGPEQLRPVRGTAW